jgi:predicted transcriptional regulator of viral defense system
VPRLHPTGRRPDLDRLYRIASGQAGYFTAAQARDAGYSRPLLGYYLARGRFERARRGIFRLAHFPPQDHEDLVILWLWSDRQAAFSHETALLLHGLSDALPSRIHVTLPEGWARRRLQLPQGVILHFADLPRTARTWRGPVPVTTALRTLADCSADSTPRDLLAQAMEQGARRGLFTQTQARSAISEAAGGAASRRIVS